MAKELKKKEEAEPTANLPVNIEDEIRKQLEAQKGQSGALSSNKIGLKNKEFKLPDGQTGKTLECVVLDFIWSHVNYPGVYNSNNPQKPNCFAIGRDPGDSGLLKPHPDAADPQHENCKECPKNEWKSAPTGNGKACKNQRKLILLAPDAKEDDEPMSMFVSPQGLKFWDAYVSRLSNEHSVLPVQVITLISFDENQTYPLLQFKFIEKHTSMNLFWGHRERAQELLFRPMDTEKG